MQQDHIKIEKVVKVLKQKGLDGLIIYSNGTCNILGPKPFVYFSEFRPLGPHNAAIISKAGDTVLMVEPEWDAARAKKACWMKVYRSRYCLPARLKRLPGLQMIWAFQMKKASSQTVPITDQYSVISRQPGRPKWSDPYENKTHMS